MSVSFYRQIYLGALGEAAGKAILEFYLGVDLEEIEDLSMYEFFDYKIGNTYIDFKDWHIYEKDNETYVEKILRKLKKVEGSKAIIINLFKRNEGKEIIMNISQNVIQIPWLINPKTNEVDENEIDKINKFY